MAECKSHRDGLNECTTHKQKDRERERERENVTLISVCVLNTPNENGEETNSPTNSLLSLSLQPSNLSVNLSVDQYYKNLPN